MKEIAADNHYILSDEKYPIVFNYAGQDTALVEIKVNDGEPIENEIIYGSIKGLKIDRETQASRVPCLVCSKQTKPSLQKKKHSSPQNPKRTVCSLSRMYPMENGL